MFRTKYVSERSNMYLDKRIIIFVGAFGSGKTEIALNYVQMLALQSKRAAIADMDIVSPYFRVRDVNEMLIAQGIEVIAPMKELAQADLPTIVPRIQGAFEESELHVVVDVGGDNIGATALGRFSEQLSCLPHELLFVVNTCRPFTQDVFGIKKMLAMIEKATHLKATGLVANSNLGSETKPEIVRNGLSIVQKAAEEIGIPVVGTAVRKDLITDVGCLDIPIFPITINLLPPWHTNPIT